MTSYYGLTSPNLLCFSCVAGLDGDEPDSTVKEEVCEEIISRTSVVDDIITSPASPADSESLRPLTDKKSRTKSRVKSSSRRMFLDDSLSDEEKVDDAGGVVLNTFGPENMRGHESEGTERRGNDYMDAEQGSSLMPLITTCENSWTCPLTFEDLPPSPSDSEMQESSSQQPVGRPSGSAKPAVKSTKCSGVVLKLRRMFSCNRKKARYQAVSDSAAFADASASRTDTSDESSEAAAHKRTAEVTHRWQRAGSFSHALRPLRNATQRKRRSFNKIKYCPYLSACHSAEHRRHLVLRSAVQRAKRAMRFYYPDLVGKRIRHLYEEADKSEVWYRGEVLRVHEAHTNPLKTIFEVRYDSEPEWRYYLELLIDYKKGWLKIEE